MLKWFYKLLRNNYTQQPAWQCINTNKEKAILFWAGKSCFKSQGSPHRSSGWCQCHAKRTKGRWREGVMMSWDRMPSPLTTRITWVRWGATEARLLHLKLRMLILTPQGLIERSGATESGEEFYLTVLRLLFSYATLNKNKKKFIGSNTSIIIYYIK